MSEKSRRGHERGKERVSERFSVLERLSALHIEKEDDRVYASPQKKGEKRNAARGEQGIEERFIVGNVVVDLPMHPMPFLFLPLFVFSRSFSPVPSFHCTRCLPDNMVLDASVKTEEEKNGFVL